VRYGTGLQARLTITALVTVLPALAAILYLEHTDAREAKAQVVVENVRIARLLAVGYADMLDGGRHLIGTLANMPQVRSRRSVACSAVLRDALSSHPEFVNLMVVDRAGHVRCTARPGGPHIPSDVSAQRWFTDALRVRRGAANAVVNAPPNRPSCWRSPCFCEIALGSPGCWRSSSR